MNFEELKKEEQKTREQLVAEYHEISESLNPLRRIEEEKQRILRATLQELNNVQSTIERAESKMEEVCFALQEMNSK